MNSQDRSIVAISSSHGIMHGYLVLLPAMIPILQGDLGDIGTIGLLATLVSLFYGWFSLPVGFFADKYSKKLLITASMILCGSAAIIVGLSPNVPVAAVGMIILGIGASLYHPCGYAHMALVSDEARGRYMGFQGLGGDMGMAISFLTSSVLGARFGWRATFLIWGVAGLAMAALDMLIVEDIACEVDPTQLRRGPIETVKRMFETAERRTLILTFIIVVLSGMLWTGVSNFIMVYITDVKMVALVIAGGLSTLKYTVGAFAQITGGELSDRLSRKLILLIGYGLFAVALVALTVAPSDLVVLTLLVVVLGFSFFVTQSPMNALLGDVSHKDTVGVTYGVNFTLKYGVGFFTPAIAGWLAQNYSLNHVFYFFAALSAAAFLVATLIKEKK
ncbi:MFS transporter [Candidatus Bathyarchaeota archaeon]|nr:MFS transporter [Candidatus Bathyarchaeota archaeon]